MNNIEIGIDKEKRIYRKYEDKIIYYDNNNIPTDEYGFLEFERLQLQRKIQEALSRGEYSTYRNLIQSYSAIIRERNDYLDRNKEKLNDKENNKNIIGKLFINMKNGFTDMIEIQNKQDRQKINDIINLLKNKEKYIKINDKNINIDDILSFYFSK